MQELADRALSASAGRLADRQRIESDMLTMVSKGVLRAMVDPPGFVSRSGPHPQATPLARDQAAQGLPVTSRLHESLQLDPVSRWLLPQLNGQVSQAQLVSLFRTAVRNGQFQVSSEGRSLSELDDASCQQVVQHSLSTLAGNALLVG